MIASLGKLGLGYIPSLSRTSHRAVSVCGHDSSTSDIERTVYSFLKGKCAIVGGSHLLLSVSGGVDSMCMLHVLARIRDMWSPPLKLSVVTFNHKLRKEADEEVEFVSSWCAKYLIPITIRVLPESQRVKSGLQVTARDWRRSEAIKILDEYSTSDISTDSFVCTAHHRDDQVETVFMKLLRGVHISNISMMLPRSNKCIKPMLSSSKNQIYDYMRQNKFDWREDSSNFERDYKRNQVRMDLVPILETLAGGEDALYNRMKALSEQSKEINDLLQQEVDTFFHRNKAYIVSICRPLDSSGILVKTIKFEVDLLKSSFLEESSVVQTNILRKLCQDCCMSEYSEKEEDGGEDRYIDSSPQISYDLLCRLKSFISRVVPSESQKTFEVSSTVNINILGSSLRFICIEKQEMAREKTEAIIINKKLNISLVEIPPDIRLRLCMNESDVDLPNGVFMHEKYCVSFRNVPANSVLTIRYYMDKDQFFPPWRDKMMKVNKFLREKNVDISRRMFVPLVVLNDKDVLAVGNIVSKPYYYSKFQQEKRCEQIPVQVDTEELIHLSIERQ